MIEYLIDGPFWYFSLAVFCIGVLLQLGRIIFASGKTDLSVARGSASGGAWRNVFSRFIPHHEIAPQIRLYLEEPPTKKELVSILRKLKIPAESLIRKSETIFKEKFKNKDLDEEGWIEAMIEFPKLIERPIVISGDNAIIGRPPENVTSLF